MAALDARMRSLMREPRPPAGPPAAAAAPAVGEPATPDATGGIPAEHDPPGD